MNKLHLESIGCLFGGIKNSGEGEGGIFYSYEDMLYNKLLIIDKS